MTDTAKGIGRRSMMKIGLAGGATLALAPGRLLAADTTLKAAWYGGQDTHNRMKDALAIFEKKNPGVKIDVEFAPFGDFWDRLAIEYQGGSAPDVHRHSMTYLYEYEKRGLLADLGGYVGSVIHTDSLYPGVVEIGTRKGITNAIGNNQIATALFYDKAKIAEAGVAEMFDGMTWDGYQEIAAKVAGVTGQYGTNDGGGFLTLFEQWLAQEGKELYPEAGGIGYEAADAEAWFAYWQAMRDSKGAPPPEITAESVGFQNAPMVKGRAAMQTGWCQQIVFFQDLMEAELDLTATPTSAGATGNGHYIRALDFWVVPEGSKNKDEAAKLIDFLLNDPDAIATLGITLGGPASDQATKILRETVNATQMKVLDYLVALRENALPGTPIWAGGHGELEATLGRLNQSVGFGQMKPAEAAAEMVSEGKRIIG